MLRCAKVMQNNKQLLDKVKSTMQNIGHAGKGIGRGISRVQYRFL